MTKKPAVKSIIASFGALSSSAAEERTAALQPGQSEHPRTVPRVGAGVIGATQRTLQEMREERERLKALVEKGGDQQLSPDLIDPSPFPDRLPDDGEAGFDAFKLSIREQGQKVPILVRPHPQSSGRYQIVFGHRRWRAARDLGISLRAQVIDLNDAELALHQGIENSERQDLSWIERALFAMRMENEGIKPRDTKAALGIDDAEMARLRQVTRAVPEDIIAAIGRAPKAGRPRWVSLAAAIERDKPALERVRRTLSSDKVLSSDERFRQALAAATRAALRSDASTDGTLSLTRANGIQLGEAMFGSSEVRIRLNKKQGTAFAAFLRDELPSLIEKFDERHLGE